MNGNDLPVVGIDDMAAYVPNVYLPIETLANARDIVYAKLNKGLGLTAMAIPDVGEDTASMLANAVKDLIEKNNITPSDIGRIYLGTESSLDGAKPTASYALELLNAYFEPKYGSDCFANCDVLDTTFACIGAVDVLQNTLDWVRCNPSRVGIIVAADNAKYELGSSGEYTQGAGAVATLVKANPRLLAIGSDWGVSTKPVYDFYKPIRKASKKDIIKEALQLAQLNHADIDGLVEKLTEGISTQGVLDSNEHEIALYKETPIFDGPYSNACYQERIKDALVNFNTYKDSPVKAIDWDRLVFHLPYAYQARRMFGEIFWMEMQSHPDQEIFQEQLQLELPQQDQFDDIEAYEKELSLFWRAVAKTDFYRQFVQQKIEKGERASSQVGNMYAGSIFLALMSTLEADSKEDNLQAENKIGFFAYGSGSKSKVFEGVLQANWKEVAQGFQIQQQLENRTEMDYTTYEKRHKGLLAEPIAPQANTFYLKEMNKDGIRQYSIPKTQQLA